MRRISTLISVGLAIGLITVTVTCTDRTDEVSPRIAVCEEYCQAEEVCFPGTSNDYINPIDMASCLDVCNSASEWRHEDCAETYTTSLGCLGGLTCEAWYTTRTVGDESVRSCTEERGENARCRARTGVASMDE